MTTYTQESIQRQIEALLTNAQELKTIYEKVCDEWNDVELALSDLNHMQEFLNLTQEGALFVYQKRKDLMKERRQLKETYQQLLPHIVYLAKVEESILLQQGSNEPTDKEVRVYGLRSIRGHNLFDEIMNYTNATDEQQLFVDLTGKQVVVNHIYRMHNEFPNYFERTGVDIQKVPQKRLYIGMDTEFKGNVWEGEGVQIEHLIPNTLADAEARASRIQQETPEEREKRLEKELHNTIYIGSKRGRRFV